MVTLVSANHKNEETRPIKNKYKRSLLSAEKTTG